MSNSIFKKPTLTARSGRNGFDVSRRRIYSTPCGVLQPVYDDFANPGDHYKLNSRSFIRTEAIETAAFMRLKYHVDWFFVPVTHLYSFWNEFFNQTQDVETSFVSLTSASKFTLPTCQIFSILNGFETNSFFASTSTNPTGIKTVTLKVDEFGQPYIWNARRLFDMFGYGTPDTSFGNVNYNVQFLKFLAYHKIFYSHYNNSQFFPNKPELFNVDKWFGQDMTSQTALVSSILSTIHYRPYHVDYFTNIQPAPTFNSNFANAQIAPLYSGLFTNNMEISYINKDSTNSDSDAISEILNVSTADEVGTFLNLANIDKVGVGDLRTLFAIDRLSRITASSGSHYDEQVFAHFGFKMPKGISKDAYFLGSQSTDININEVVATASTGYEGAGSTIGDIAGKGFGVSNGEQDVDFTAPCHGFIMGIASIEPIPDYASQSCELFNRYKDTLDFYHPEFDNIGMVPMYDAFFLGNYASNNSSAITGWTYRYSELKTKFDVVNESIWNTYRSNWAGFKQNLFGLDRSNSEGKYVSPNLKSLFFIAPQYTNNIFLLDVPTYSNSVNDLFHRNPASYTYNSSDAGGFKHEFMSANNVYKGDSFLVNLDIKAFKTSIMSVHSLPKFL
ncbi:major capsid protein [Dipodfec virus UOA04_Rod_468]|nr:major capsid protein [Dipodfec virus UOA04_Rod_468]